MMRTKFSPRIYVTAVVALLALPGMQAMFQTDGGDAAATDPVHADPVIVGAPDPDLRGDGRIWFVATFSDPSHVPSDAVLATHGLRAEHRFEAIPALAASAPDATAVKGFRGVSGLVEILFDRETGLLLDTTTTSIRAAEVWQDAWWPGDFVSDQLELFDGTPIDGRGVTVGVVDTGANGLHPDLWYHALEVAGTTPPEKMFACVHALGVNVDQPYCDETVGHGTHVSGIAVGNSWAFNNGLAPLGSALGENPKLGVAPGSDLVVAGTGAGIFVLNFLVALDWMYANADAYNIRVINNSYGSTQSCNDGLNPSSAEKSIIDALVDDKGIVMVYAAGNYDLQGNPTFTSPTSSYQKPGVISVANYDDQNSGTRDGAVNRGSSNGCPDRVWTWPDVAAPGTGVISTTSYTGTAVVGTWDPPFYGVATGTSMAAPHVAGTVALMLQADPSLTPAQVERILIETATPWTDGVNEGGSAGTAMWGSNNAATGFSDPSSCTVNSGNLASFLGSHPVGTFDGTDYIDADLLTCRDIKRGHGLVDAYAAVQAAVASGSTDSDGDGVPDSADICPGHDDNVDSDGDGIPDGCDGGSTPGTTTTWYFGRGDPQYFVVGDDADLSASGNLHQILSAESNLPLKLDSPTASDPAIVHTSFLDSPDHPNYIYEAGYWSTPGPVSINNSDVTVSWWAMAPATGPGFVEVFDLTLYRDDQVIASATDVEFSGVVGTTPSEFTHNFTGVPAGDGRLAVKIDPSGGDVLSTSPVGHEYDYFILYDSPDTPSRLVVTEYDADPDSDGDGVPDSEDICPGHDDNVDSDGDGVPDGCDAFPNDPSESADSDGDGVGDNSDVCPGHDDNVDSDGDGIPDGCDDPVGDPDVTITDPADGATVAADFTVNGTVTLGSSGSSQARADALGAQLPSSDDLKRLRLEVPEGASWNEIQSSHGLTPELLWSSSIGPGTPIAMAFTPGATFPEFICTANWLWKDHNGEVHLGAAGHCFLESGYRTTHGDTGDVDHFDPKDVQVWACSSDCFTGGVLQGIEDIFLGNYVKLGEVVYARQDPPNGNVAVDGDGVGHDFGLVAVPDGLLGHTDPAMPGWGGPVGVWETDSFLLPMVMHGSGAVWGETFLTKNRVGDSLGTLDGMSWLALILAAGGDSGSAVSVINQPLLGPEALGLLTHGIGEPVFGAGPLAVGTKVPRAVQMAHDDAGLCIRPLLAGEDAASAPAPDATGDCDDGTAPTSTVQVRVDGGGWTDVDTQDLSAGTWSHDLAGLAAGTRNVEARLLQNGVQTASDSITVTVDTTVAGCELQNGQPRDYTQSQGGQETCSFEVPTGRQTLDVVMTGPACEVDGVFCSDVDHDLYVRFGAPPTLDEYDCRPFVASNQESCSFEGPAAGTWFVMVEAFQGEGTVTVTASYDIVDSDGDGVPDSEDICPGHDDNIDSDGDGIPDGCDDDGLVPVAVTTLYFGRGDPQYFLVGDDADLSASGNLHQILSAESNLPLDEAAPDSASPAIVHTSFLDSLEHPNYAYDAGYWSTPGPVSLLQSDVEVTWWAIAPVTGVAFAENFDVTLYRDDQVIATATLQFEGTPAATPTEFNHTFTGVPAGDGRLSVKVDPSGGDVLDTSRVSHEYDYFILYDSVDTPSRIVVTELALDSDGDGVPDSEDICPGHDDNVDSDGDGVPDGCDAFPNDPSESADSDGDGVGDNSDVCPGHDDNADLDGDGIPDGCDSDRDGDGFSNDEEVAAGTDPDDPSSFPEGDGGNMGDGDGSGPDCTEFGDTSGAGPIMCRSK